MAGFPRDPYETKARFDGKCSCGAAIRKGDPIFYYPNTKAVLAIGKPCQCGDKARRDFDAARADESGY